MREEIAVRVRELRSKTRPILSKAPILVLVLMLLASGVAVAQSDFDFIEQWDHSEQASGTSTGISTNENGRLWLVDFDSPDSHGYLYDTDGDFTGVTGDFPSETRAVTYNSTSDRYYVAQFPDTVIILDGDLNQIDSVTQPSMESPETIHIGPDGLIWVGDQFDNEFYLFGAGGTTEGSVSSPIGIGSGTGSEYGNDGFTYLTASGDVNRLDGDSSGLSDTGFSSPINGSQGLVETDGGVYFTRSSDTVYAYSGTEDNGVDLEIDTRNLIPHGETVDYTVVDREAGEDVTDQATVTSDNTSVITVDETEHTLTAVDDENVSEVVNITAEYNGQTAVKQVVVSPVTVENLRILPTWHRVSAVIGDDTMFIIIVSSFMGILGTRLATSFAGISAIELTLVVGWVGGYLSLGMIMVSTMMCIFIGLNLAANIDYQVRR